MEYGSLIWSAYCNTYIDDLERPQHKFLRLAVCHSGDPMPRYSHNYEYVLTKLNLTTLAHRRKIADLVFVNRIFNGPISCPNIIEMFKLNVPSRSPRHSELLHIEHHRTYHGFCNPYNRTFINSSHARCLIDVFDHSFKRSLLSISLEFFTHYQSHTSLHLKIFITVLDDQPGQY